MGDDKLATFKCDSQLWEKFRTKARRNNSSASALLKAFMQSYVDGSVELSVEGSIEAGKEIEDIKRRLALVEQQLGESQAV